ncbi:phosphate starvation-inducible PhoH-like protein [Pseudochelatococcus lubricantis]|uniref:Phosphate starvation-inducible PhoH-like protein n=1 Tax=Pseudochelatococcus lubricantis TaxID=1538102 RepID=A0ABX0UZE5_9HYPH|nr:phosphate starvation-inducible PhoH-like protein [Pseudochelatococcus lubricantis]
MAPRTQAQSRYRAAIAASDITFGIGPAGTGKSYVAVSDAADALKRGDIERIVITRPITTVGNSLGYFPGGVDEKIAPYIAPIREILDESFGVSFVTSLIKSGKIVAAPVELMRGATFRNAWVIVDEAQNLTFHQLKTILTRAGEGAKTIIDGDPGQIDVPAWKSGLMEAVDRLMGVDGVRIVHFDRSDIVRSSLVRRVLAALDGP